MTEAKLKVVNFEEFQTLFEHLKHVNGKWAIVSKTDGRPLRYYDGEGKPSVEWVAKQEREIEFFKHQG